MANPNPGSGGQPTGSKRKHSALFDPSKFNSAKKPTTINITNSINPAPIVPGQNTYPPARPPATDPRKRGLSFADLSGQQLANILDNPDLLAKRQKTDMGCKPSLPAQGPRRPIHQPSRPLPQSSFQLPEIPQPSPSASADQFDTTVGTEEEGHLDDEPLDQFDHTVGAEEEDHLYDDEPLDQFDHTARVEEEDHLDGDEPFDQFDHTGRAEEEDHLYDDDDPVARYDRVFPPAKMEGDISDAEKNKLIAWYEKAKREGLLNTREIYEMNNCSDDDYDDDEEDLGPLASSSSSSSSSILSGNSEDGVINYEDVAGYANEALPDDDKNEEASKPPRQKGKKRKRYETYEWSTDTSTYYSSDDSRGE